MQGLIVSLLLQIVFSQDIPTAVTIGKDFSEKHLAAITSPPARRTVFELQRKIKSHYPGRTTNHIIFLDDVITLHNNLIKHVQEMINGKRCVEHKDPGKVTIKCTSDSNLFANGIVWSNWQTPSAPEPISCTYAASCTVEIGLLQDYTIHHLFPIKAADCRGVEECWGAAGYTGGSRHLESVFALLVSLIRLRLGRTADDMKLQVDSGVTSEEHPELFDIRAMLPQPEVKKPGQQPDHVIREYFEKGFILIPDFFTKEELDLCRKTTEELVDDLATKLYDAGKIREKFEHLDLFHRLTKLEEAFPGANVILHKVPNMPMGYRTMWANERLLNLVEQIIGPDIAGNSVWNLRTKTPQSEATTVPWHQDVGYLDNSSYKMLIPSAWVPLLDANETNGCLQFAEGGHRTGRVGLHRCCWGGTWYVELDEDDMKHKLGVDTECDIKTVPVPYGGLVLFNNFIPHRSLPNMSDDVRWSLDLRWQRPSDPDGLWGLKKPVVMRLGDKPDMAIDWTEFDAVDRHAKQKQSVASEDGEAEEDPEFDTTLPGPWMKKWEIVHMNKHTDRHARDEAKRD